MRQCPIPANNVQPTLNKQLAEAVLQEKYELAARLRDAIQTREGKAAS